MDKLRAYELDPTKGLAIRPRNKKYVENDKALKVLVEGYELLGRYTDLQIMEHLRAIQFRLMSNGYDTIDDSPIENAEN